MTIDPAERHQLEEVLHVDATGITPVADGNRDGTALQMFWIWSGANLAPISWIVGTIGMTLGLSLLETILVTVIGQAVGAAIFGLSALMGHRTGVCQMVLARVAFGRRGAYLPAALQTIVVTGWIGVNTYVVVDLVLGILRELGVNPGTGSTYMLAGAIMIGQILIAVWGFYAIRTIEKYAVPLVAAVMVAMTVLVLARIDEVSWTQSSLAGADKFTAMTQLLTAVGVGWAMGWMTWASDYSRFTSLDVSPRRLYASSVLGIFAPLAWLSVLGALAGATSDATDPVGIVTTLFGAATIPVLCVILHGPVAANVVNIYTASLGLLALDIKIKRAAASVLAGIVGFIPLVMFLESSSFSSSFGNFMSSLVVWMSPWAGVTLVDWFVIHRQQVDVASLYAPPTTSRYGDVNVRALGAFALGLAAAWSCQYGPIAAFQGPIARLTGQVDLSWAVGLSVSASVYYCLVRRRTIHLEEGAAESSTDSRPLGS
ncbi:purine-cytosine permease family protein [Embleya sp. NPDC050154]|uniref:purine-cytosine permease family protein n=1 Tax=Embleya sp. NPDC050154 TaxID=3363988 RepID=UPI0037BC2818